VVVLEIQKLLEVFFTKHAFRISTMAASNGKLVVVVRPSVCLTFFPTLMQSLKLYGTYSKLVARGQQQQSASYVAICINRDLFNQYGSAHFLQSGRNVLKEQLTQHWPQRVAWHHPFFATTGLLTTVLGNAPFTHTNSWWQYQRHND